MAKNFLSDLSTTAGSNTDLAGVGVAGSNLVSQGDNAFRSLAAMLAQFYEDLGGLGTVGGTGDDITLTAKEAWTAYGTGDGQIANGTILAFKAGAANTGAVTINVNAIGTKAIQAQGDTALGAGALVANAVYLLRYDTAYNAAAGAWVLLNGGSAAASTTEQLTGTSTAKASTPDSVAALWEKGSDVASSGTISLGEGGFFHITGTTTITDIDFATAKDGRTATLIFDGALTLTHNSTTLKLPGNANIVTAAGDRAVVVQDSGDNVICLAYQRADGSPVNVATAANFQANTASKSLDTTGVWGAAASVALTDAATIVVTTSSFINAHVTLGGNRTMGQPTGLTEGKTGRLRIKQDATGSRTLTWHADYEFASGTAPTLSTAANAEDVFYYDIIGANRVLITGPIKAVA